MQDIKVIKKQICEVGRRIYEKGMAASNDGNISVRLDNGNFCARPQREQGVYDRRDDLYD
jgi:L-fuculose-phosphate aldolase